jgi:hypothetical protein
MPFRTILLVAAMSHIFRYVMVLLCLSLLAGCTSTNTNESAASGDSGVYYSDTSTFVESDSVYATPNDAPEIKSVLDSLIEDHGQNDDSYYTLRLSASGYEYRTEEVWSFDSLMNLVHCYQDWSSEGTEGSSHHFFRQNRLYAVRDENGNDSETEVTIFHAELGGISFSATSPSDTVVTVLEKNFLVSSENDLRSQFAQIVKLLKDNAGDISSDDPATLHAENDTADEELPGKETTDITVDRKLLEDLIR